MSPRARARSIVAVVLVLLAAGLWQARRAWIQTWFLDGPGRDVARPADDRAPLVPRSGAVRVLLIDGLSAEVADTLPRLSRFCTRGVEVRVDTGFPTVSLPVQHVLWTGRTQAQSGIEYRIPRLDPPAPVIAAVGGSSVAVAESHRDIVHSFAFDRVLPPLADEEIEAADSTWRAGGFEAAAIDAVTSDARLAFVHVLRVDEAGHADGRASEAYADAARWADDLLGTLVDAAGAETTWFVLADHGHRAGGGHGGPEPEIRLVRGCIVAPSLRPEDRRDEGPVALVDFHREIVAATGATPDPVSPGRSLRAPLAAPLALPAPSAVAWAVALSAWAAGVAFVARRHGRQVRAWPWWIALAWLGAWLVAGSLTLSNPAVYPKLPTHLWLGAAPAAAWLGYAVHSSDAAGTTLRRTLADLAVPWLAGGLGIFALTILPAGGAGGFVLPPLMPVWTALSSAWLSWGTIGAAAAGLAFAWSAWRVREPGPR